MKKITFLQKPPYIPPPFPENLFAPNLIGFLETFCNIFDSFDSG